MELNSRVQLTIVIFFKINQGQLLLNLKYAYYYLYQLILEYDETRLYTGVAIKTYFKNNILKQCKNSNSIT